MPMQQQRMVLQQTEWELRVAAGLQLEMRQPGGRRVDPEDFVYGGEDCGDVRFDRLDWTIHRQPEPGEPARRVGFDQMTRCDVERVWSSTLLHETRITG